jgi:hypothetical protein
MDNSNQPGHPFTRFMIIFMVGLVLLSILLMALGEWKYPLSGHPTFNKGIRTNYLKDMNALQPEIVFIGDSTLRWGVDENVVSASLGRKIEKIGIQGSASALWYLLIKNNILQADHRPNMILLFFRDTMLTDPAYRVYGDYFLKIDEYGNDSNQTLINKAYSTPLSQVDRFLLRFLPLYAERANIQNWVNSWLQPLLSGSIARCDETCIEDAKASVFAFERLNPEVYSHDVEATETQLYTLDKLLFNRQYPNSFLPDIITLCKWYRVDLVLVRLGTTRFADKADEPFLLQNYLRELASKMEQEGVTFLEWDYNAVPLSGYRDSVHLNPEGRDIYTNLLTQQLQQILKK